MTRVEVKIKSEFVDGNHVIDSEWVRHPFAVKMEFVTGIPPEFQEYKIVSPAGQVLETEWTNQTLNDLGVATGSEICINDTRPADQQLVLDDPTSNDLSYEEYEKRKGTLLDYKRTHKLGRFSDQPRKAKLDDKDHGTCTLPLNTPCFAKLSNGNEYRGTVEFIGDVDQLPSGQWVGVNLLTPDGKNNGTVKGVKLFNALPNHGIVVRPDCIRPLESVEEEL